MDRQNDGTITLGELVVEIQFIGTESGRPHEWMWGGRGTAERWTIERSGI